MSIPLRQIAALITLVAYLTVGVGVSAAYALCVEPDGDLGVELAFHDRTMVEGEHQDRSLFRYPTSKHGNGVANEGDRCADYALLGNSRLKQQTYSRLSKLDDAKALDCAVSVFVAATPIVTRKAPSGPGGSVIVPSARASEAVAVRQATVLLV